MPSRARIILIVLISAVALLSAGAYAYWHFLLHGPFAGETYHDFGDVALFDENEEVQHTFHLTNRLAKPLSIVAIRPECGCLTTRDLRRTLQPGEAFDLPVTLVAKGGERVVLIRVIFDDDSQASLRVRANGRYQPKLHLDPPIAALGADGSAEIAMSLYTYETWDEPAAPAITASSDAIAAEFVQPWKLKYRPKDVVMTPTQWDGVVRVRFTGDASALPDDASITLSCPPARPLTIALRKPGTVITPSAPKLTIP